MQPTYQELFDLNQQLILQNQQLNQRLEASLDEIQILKTEIKDLKTKIKDLEEKLNTNSSNSSKPPSQDPFRKRVPKTSTGRKQGAQKDHTGHSRVLVPIEQVHSLLDVRPENCPNCHSSDFESEAISTDIRQVFELPQIAPKVVQFNIHTCCCKCCGKHVKANIPNEAKYGFGPRLMGFITTLSGEFRLSKRQIVTLMGKIGIQICAGSVCKIHARASTILARPYADIKMHTLNQEHLNADETGWKTLKETRWIWVGYGLDSVFFEIKARRTASAFQDVFGEFNGGLTTDRHGAYNVHEGPRQLCWSHAGRDFEKISIRDGFDKFIGDQLLASKSEVFDLWHRFKSQQMTRSELIQHMENGPKKNLELWLKAGVIHEDTQAKTKATCGNFLDRFQEMWLFIYKEGVEPTNNAAERSLRYGVIWRKLSYGTQSEVGERFVERVMTVAMTLKLQAQNSFDYFTECFKAFIQGGQAPPIFST